MCKPEGIDVASAKNNHMGQRLIGGNDCTNVGIAFFLFLFVFVFFFTLNYFRFTLNVSMLIDMMFLAAAMLHY